MGRSLAAPAPALRPMPIAEEQPGATGPTVRPCSTSRLTVDAIEALAAGVEQQVWSARRGVRPLLRHLATLPGETWQDRWTMFEATCPERSWDSVTTLDSRLKKKVEYLTGAVSMLMLLDVVRPSYEWMHQRRFNTIKQVLTHRDAEGTDLLVAELRRLGVTPSYLSAVVTTVARLCAHTGAAPRQISTGELLEQFEAGRRIGKQPPGIQLIWRTMRQLGWIATDQVNLPTRQTPPMTPTEMVDYYTVPSPQREVLIEYLTTRSAEMDYNSLRLLATNLISRFWSRILARRPDLQGFVLDKATVERWKQESFDQATGDLRASHYQTLFAVRAFYHDIASWAINDSYWAQWVAPCPVSRSDIRGYVKLARRQVATMQQRTRELSALLPRLVTYIEGRRSATAALLERVRQAGPGAEIDVDGATWLVHQTSPASPLRLRDGQQEMVPEFDETTAFWTWALVETLRHTGLRIEEVLELTHLAIQPYKIPATGETVPLVHIVPSKTDQERLVVASPELIHVLAEVIHRAREGNSTIALTQRWDPYEHQLSEPLPHLFAKRVGNEQRVISPAIAYKHLRDAAEGAQLESHGRLMRFTAHDFRRIFATDALSSGLPPHIVQVLMGHKSLATTQGYAAVYPQDVIRHHRTYIAQRRQTRPTAEYREPTAEEWEEFESHFVKRKVSLGSCGRAYGTSCQHEHACLRCSLLRPDPSQIERLTEIITNLSDRIDEAEDQGWLGEVDGLKISLAGAEAKLRQMTKQLDRRDEPVELGLPRLRPVDRTETRQP